jgi:ArsR family transcriptional regulator
MKNNIATAILDKCEDVSQVLKSLSHPVRLKVLCQVMDGERSVNELTVFCGISQSAMSQFLNRMKADGMLAARREGTHIYYSVANPDLVKLLKAIKEIYC